MKKNLFLSVSYVVLFALMVYAVTLGSVYIEAKIILRSILEWIKYGMDGVTCDDSIRFIIFEVRLPRIILAVLTGSLLSMAGAVYQAIFQNPMADPYVIGISSGAAFGATIAIIFLPPMILLGNSIVSLADFVCAVFTSILVYFISKTKRGVDTFSLLLTGVIFSTVLSSFISLIMLAHQDEAMKIMTWTMGSFNAKSWNHVITILVPTVVGIFFTIYHGKDLNVLVMGDEEAEAMGLNTKVLKRNMLLICALLTSIAVSVSGIIGFVGLIVPHFIRLIFGSEHKFLLKASFVFGAIFMLLSDTIARSLIDGFEVPVGIITSLIGGPLFLILLVRYRRSLR